MSKLITIEEKINDAINNLMDEHNCLVIEAIPRMDFRYILDTEVTGEESKFCIDFVESAAEMLKCNDFSKLLGAFILIDENEIYSKVSYDNNIAKVVDIMDHALEIYGTCNHVIKIDYPDLPSFREMESDTELYHSILSDIKQKIGKALFEYRNPEFRSYSFMSTVTDFLENIDYKLYISGVIDTDFDMYSMFVEDYTLYFCQYSYM